MTPEQRSRQASRNSNAKRITWQREAMRCKVLLIERQEWIDRMGVEDTRLATELRKQSDELQSERKRNRELAILALEWRTQAENWQIELVTLRTQAKLDAMKAAERREP